MSSYTYSIVTDGQLVFGYYQPKIPNGKCIIVAIGAPNLMDVDGLRNAEVLTSFGYAVLVPEYYGFCRSQGIFTPFNTIQTLIDAYTIAQGKSSRDLIKVYSGATVTMQYTDISFLGMSYGGFAVLVLPKFLPEAKKIGALYPVTDYASFGKCGVKEETVEDFLESIRRGFSHMYRGIDDPSWDIQFADQLGLTPIYERAYLQGAAVFLAHGTHDQSIYYQKTRHYADELRWQFPQNTIVYREYPSLGHGIPTMIPASYEFCGWLESI